MNLFGIGPIALPPALQLVAIEPDPFILDANPSNSPAAPVTMLAIPSWVADLLKAPLEEKLAVLSLSLATIAIVLSIWDKVRVAFWNRYRPVWVRFDPNFIDELKDFARRPEGTESALRILFTVRNRVDYRLLILVGGSMSGDLIKLCHQELLDQIDVRAPIAPSKEEPQLITWVDAHQSRYLEWRIVFDKDGGSGVITPSVTFLVSKRGPSRRRVSTWKRSVNVVWNGQIYRFEVAPTPDVPGHDKRNRVGY